MYSLCLASFMPQHIYERYPRCFMCQLFILFYCCIISYCINKLRFVFSSLLLLDIVGCSRSEAMMTKQSYMCLLMDICVNSLDICIYLGLKLLVHKILWPLMF